MFKAPIEILAHKSYITALAFTPDSKILFSAGMDNVVNLWSVPEWLEMGSLTGHLNSVNSIHLVQNGTQVVTASTDRSVRLWDVAERRQIRQYDFKGHTAFMSPDGQIIAAIDNPWLTLAGFQTGEIKKRYKPFPKRTTALSFSPRDGFLAVGGQGDDLLIYSPSDFNLLHTIQKAHVDFTLSVRFSPTGVHLVTVGHEKILKFWEPGTWVQLGEVALEHQGVQSTAFSPDGRYLAIASDHLITLVDTVKTQIIHRVELVPKGVYCLAFSADGHWLACGSADKQLRIFELELND